MSFNETFWWSNVINMMGNIRQQLNHVWLSIYIYVYILYIIYFNLHFTQLVTTGHSQTWALRKYLPELHQAFGPPVWVFQAWCRAFAKSLTQTIKASPGVGEKVSPGLVSEPGSGNTLQKNWWQGSTVDEKIVYLEDGGSGWSSLLCFFCELDQIIRYGFFWKLDGS